MKTYKIGICGTQSVGKSTLVKSLSNNPKFANFKLFTEKSKEIKDIGVPLNVDSTLMGQTIFLSYRVKELMSPYMFTDRTILDVIAFTNCAKSINQHCKEEFEQYALNFLGEYDYIFYIPPEGIPIVDNGIREVDEHYRDLIDFAILHLIKRYSHRIKNFHSLQGTTKERTAQMLNIIGL